MNTEKPYSCDFCKKKFQDLTKLPFNRLICDSCIEYKCLNEFKGDNEPNEDFDKINTVGLFMDRIDKHHEKLRLLNSKNSNNIGAKLYKIKNRVLDFKDYLNNYEKKISSKMAILKFELDFNYRINFEKIEKKRHNLLNLVNMFEDEILENLKNNRQNIKKSIDKFVEKNTAWNNYLNTELMKLKENVDYEVYKNSIESQINNFLIELNSSKFITIKNFSLKNAIPDRISFTNLEIKSIKKENSDNDSQCEKSSSESIFSMDSILNIKKINTSLIKSIFTLEFSNQEWFVLHIIQSSNSFLKIISKLGEICYELNFDYEIYSVNCSGTNIFVCHQDPLDKETFVKMSIFDGQLKMLESKQINFIDFSEKRIIDFCVEDNKVFILTTDKTFKCLTVYILNLSMDLLNSLELNPSGLLNMDNVVFFKIYAKNDKIYVKQKTLFGSQINIINATDPTIFKTIYLSYNFSHFFVIDFDQNLSDGKIVFFSNTKLYVYDIKSEKILMKTFFFSSKIEGKNLHCNFCITKDNQIVSLMID